MRISILFGGALVLAGVISAAPAPAQGSGYEARVLAEVNRLRDNPAAYADDLVDYRQRFEGNIVIGDKDGPDFSTREGVRAVDEAIAALDRAPPVARLAPSPLLARAAADHVAAQSRSGEVGHISGGRDPGGRAIARGGGRDVGEVITYGHSSPASAVRQLIVDDGVPSRGHRIQLLGPRYRYAGVACGSHAQWRTMCVIMLSETADGSPPPPKRPAPR